MAKSIYKKSTSYKVFLVCNTLIMLLLGFLFLAPYLNVIANALNDPSNTAYGGAIGLIPRKLT